MSYFVPEQILRAVFTLIDRSISVRAADAALVQQSWAQAVLVRFRHHVLLQGVKVDKGNFQPVFT